MCMDTRPRVSATLYSWGSTSGGVFIPMYMRRQALHAHGRMCVCRMPSAHWLTHVLDVVAHVVAHRLPLCCNHLYT